MIAYLLLAAAAALLFWPEPKRPSLEDREMAIAKPQARRPAKKRKESPRNERKA